MAKVREDVVSRARNFSDDEGRASCEKIIDQSDTNTREKRDSLIKAILELFKRIVDPGGLAGAKGDCRDGLGGSEEEA